MWLSQQTFMSWNFSSLLKQQKFVLAHSDFFHSRRIYCQKHRHPKLKRSPKWSVGNMPWIMRIKFSSVCHKSLRFFRWFPLMRRWCVWSTRLHPAEMGLSIVLVNHSIGKAKYRFTATATAGMASKARIRIIKIPAVVSFFVFFCPHATATHTKPRTTPCRSIMYRYGFHLADCAIWQIKNIATGA